MRSRIPDVPKLVARLLLLLVGALCFFTGDPTLHAEGPDPCGVPQEQASSVPAPQSTLNTFKYIEKSIIYPVCLRGRRGILMSSNIIVDTATNRTILDQEVTRMLQLPEVGTANIVAPGGTISAAKLVEAEIEIEGEHFSKLTVSVQNLSQYSRAHKTSIAGVLGTDFIKQYVMFIDYSGRRIGFFRALPKLDGFKQLATVPFRSEKGMLLIECSLPEAIQTEVMIDTGHILDLQLYEDVASQLKLGPAVSHRKLGGASDSHQVTLYEFSSISLHGYRVDNVTVDVHPLISPNAFSTRFKPGLLGQGILERYAVEIDFLTSNMRLYQKTSGVLP